MWLNNNLVTKLLEEEELIVECPREWTYHLIPHVLKIGEYGTVIAQYKKAMSKHSTYVCNTLFHHIFNEYGKVLKYKHSYCVYYDTIGKEREYVKIFSHFAPYSMREGVEMLKHLRDSEDLCVFAVTPYLGEMLKKLGYIYIADIPQLFEGKAIMKQIYCNDNRMFHLCQTLLSEV